MGLSAVEENDVRYAALPYHKILAWLDGLCMLGRQQSGPLQIPILSPLHPDFHLIRPSSHLIFFSTTFKCSSILMTSKDCSILQV
jgi:hypothetical protein